MPFSFINLEASQTKLNQIKHQFDHQIKIKIRVITMKSKPYNFAKHGKNSIMETE